MNRNELWLIMWLYLSYRCVCMPFGARLVYFVLHIFLMKSLCFRMLMNIQNSAAGLFEAVFISNSLGSVHF